MRVSLFLLKLLCTYFSFFTPTSECGLQHRVRNSPNLLAAKLFKDKRKSGHSAQVFFYSSCVCVCVCVMFYHYIYIIYIIYLSQKQEIYRIQYRAIINMLNVLLVIFRVNILKFFLQTPLGNSW